MKRSPSGFVLLSVLWFLTGVAGLGLAAMLIARGAVQTASNRTALVRAEWRAEECLARVFAAFTARARAITSDESPRMRSPNALEVRDALLSSPLVADCPGEVDLEPFGSTLNVNDAREAMLRRTFIAYGIGAAEADSLTDTLLDWRDADDSARAFGAERAWYESRGEKPPRNGPLADLQELREVRGFARWMDKDRPGLEAILGVDGGRVFVDVVPLPVLSALPGMSALATSAIGEQRSSRRESFAELLSVLGVVPAEARPPLEAAFGELGDAMTVSLEGWVLRARSSGVPEDPRAKRLMVQIELRVVSDGPRLAVIRRRIKS